MKELNFNHLYYFTIIAEQGSIVRASKVLHLTQPAISHQLRQLEDDLGEKLFDRKGKRLVLNNSGRLVLEYATKIFRQAEEMKAALKSKDTQQIKTINIAVLPWVPSEFVLNKIQNYLHRPYLHFNIVKYEIDEILKKIKSGDIDLALGDSPYSGRSKYLRGKLIEKDEIVCVANYKLKIDSYFPKSLENKNVVVYSHRSRFSDDITNFLDDLDFPIKYLGRFSDMQMVIQAITNQNCISFLPLSIATQLESEKKLKILGKLPKIRYELWALTKSNLKKESIIREILDSV